MRSIALALSLSVVLAACGGSSAPGGNGGGSGGGAGGGSAGGSAGGSSSGHFTLSVTAAKLDYAIGSVRPASGNVFVDVGVTLANSGEATPLPTAFPLFSLTSTSALVYAASAATAALSGACASGVSVAEGGSLSCRVAFEMPASPMPRSLTYVAPDQRTATASMAGVSIDAPVSTVTGSEGGISLTVADALAVVQTTNCPNTSSLSEVIVSFTDIGGYCARVQGGREAPNATQLTLFLAATGTTPIAPGTYQLGNGTGVSGFAGFGRTDSTCTMTGSGGYSATSESGSVTLSSITSTAVVGTFMITFSDGGAMSGTFNAPVCQPTAGSSCSTSTPTCGP